MKHFVQQYVRHVFDFGPYSLNVSPLAHPRSYAYGLCVCVCVCLCVCMCFVHVCVHQ